MRGARPASIKRRSEVKRAILQHCEGAGWRALTCLALLLISCNALARCSYDPVFDATALGKKDGGFYVAVQVTDKCFLNLRSAGVCGGTG